MKRIDLFPGQAIDYPFARSTDLSKALTGEKAYASNRFQLYPLRSLLTASVQDEGRFAWKPLFVTLRYEDGLGRELSSTEVIYSRVTLP